jgi:hypothetical protein
VVTYIQPCLLLLTLVNGFLTFVPPLVGARTPALPEYLFFATIETVCTSVIIWQAWTWSGVEAAVRSERIVASWKLGSLLLNYRIAQKCTQTIHAFGGHRADRERQDR